MNLLTEKLTRKINELEVGEDTVKGDRVQLAHLVLKAFEDDLRYGVVEKNHLDQMKKFLFKLFKINDKDLKAMPYRGGKANY